MLTPFTRHDFDRANEVWGCNCGPGALAAIMGMTLDEVRPHMGDFERKRYTNPSLMLAALRSIGRPWSKVGPAAWPSYGLVRVQWEGPWTAPGVPMRARYRYTHWIGCWTAGADYENSAVGTAIGTGNVGIFDINAMANGSGWCSREDWAETIVPYILQQYPKASGGWHCTHGLWVDRSGKKFS